MVPEFKTILYATDLSATSLEAFRYALSLALRYGAKIHVLHVRERLSEYAEKIIEQHLPLEVRERAYQDSVKETWKQVQNFCAEETCKLPNGEESVAKINIREGVPFQEILAEAKAIKADLIVLGQHGHSLVTEALFMGGTARKVMHHTHLPVLAVRLPR
jgi:nucleotide-binding universal stress UspA family protein